MLVALALKALARTADSTAAVKPAVVAVMKAPAEEQQTSDQAQHWAIALRWQPVGVEPVDFLAAPEVLPAA
jgi:hypothetical protein